jgi:two-component system sensor kinase FixL
MELAGIVPRVAGDRVHLQQVLLNLLLNGVHATSGQPPDRRKVVVRTAAPDGVVEVAISDRGHGIAPDQLRTIFQPFVTTKSDGLGVGLSISRTIVEAHGGRIAAENNPDGGATVRFSLPVPPAVRS